MNIILTEPEIRQAMTDYINKRVPSKAELHIESIKMHRKSTTELVNSMTVEIGDEK